ncbi:MAG TPA: hypothetical protein VMW10_11760 [Alphaproteobacteria bacterium]|nr:hypothetical protein [Alphaproteobacteria bacterium]
MNDILFELTDANSIKWSGKRMGNGENWLLRLAHNNQWVTVRKIEEQEVEEYQRMARCYTRA